MGFEEGKEMCKGELIVAKGMLWMYTGKGIPV